MGKKRTQRDSTLGKKKLLEIKIEREKRSSRKKLDISRTQKSRRKIHEQLCHNENDENNEGAASQCTVSTRATDKGAKLALSERMKNKRERQRLRQIQLKDARELLCQNKNAAQKTSSGNRPACHGTSGLKKTDDLQTKRKAQPKKGITSPKATSTTRVQKHRQLMGAEGWDKKRLSDRAYSKKRRELGVTKIIKELSDRNAVRKRKK